MPTKRKRAISRGGGGARKKRAKKANQLEDIFGHYLIVFDFCDENDDTNKTTVGVIDNINKLPKYWTDDPYIISKVIIRF